MKKQSEGQSSTATRERVGIVVGRRNELSEAPLGVLLCPLGGHSFNKGFFALNFLVRTNKKIGI